MRFLALLPIVAIATLGSAAIHADTFNFSFGASGDLLAGAGVLTGSLSSPGEYIITAIQGATTYPGYSNVSITGLLTRGSFQGNDNLLVLGSTGYSFDPNGVSYQLSDFTDINLYTDASLGGAEAFGRSQIPLEINTLPPQSLLPRQSPALLSYSAQV